VEQAKQMRDAAYERSELAESCLASLAENGDPARTRQRGRMSAELLAKDIEKTVKNGSKNGPGNSVE
jgi:hypothetical protein